MIWLTENDMETVSRESLALRGRQFLFAATVKLSRFGQNLQSWSPPLTELPSTQDVSLLPFPLMRFQYKLFGLGPFVLWRTAWSHRTEQTKQFYFSDTSTSKATVSPCVPDPPCPFGVSVENPSGCILTGSALLWGQNQPRAPFVVKYLFSLWR